ncbi:sensor histidine kinase, partial [Aliarcobacter butzleri]
MYIQFYIKLIIATSFYIIDLSFIFYEYAKNSFYNDIQDNLLRQAEQIERNYISPDKFTPVKTDIQTINLIKSYKYKGINFSNFNTNN